MTELTEQVRTLREAGRTPKEIARALGVRPAEVTTIVRALAAAAASGQPAVAGAWISHGWSTGLTVEGHPEWPDVAGDDSGKEGMACVAVARRHRPQRLSVCGYLVDTYCLGVKNARGPEILNDRDMPEFLFRFFGAIQDDPPLQVDIELARHLACGAVDYARALGFEPHADYAATAPHLGTWEGPSAITFGRDGMPMYVAGPHDNPRSVVRTLTRTVGEGNFHYMVPM